MAFDECTPYPCEYDYAKQSMHMTHRWLKKCCERFDTTEGKYGYEQTFFPIVQGSVYKDLRLQSAEKIAALGAQSSDDGLLFYKYIPKTGDWGTADAAYPCLSPADSPNRVVKKCWSGEGTVEFHKARWEDMPTQYNIVNTLYDLEIREYRGASVTKKVGAKDYRDQRILR